MLALRIFVQLIVALVFLVCGSAASFRGHLQQGQLVEIMLSRLVLQEFRYEPTDQGYILRYKLPDGTTREEMAFITDREIFDRGTASRPLDARGKPRPRFGTKNRKLSPKSLQSLAG